MPQIDGEELLHQNHHLDGRICALSHPLSLSLWSFLCPPAQSLLGLGNGLNNVECKGASEDPTPPLSESPIYRMPNIHTYTGYYPNNIATAACTGALAVRVLPQKGMEKKTEDYLCALRFNP